MAKLQFSIENENFDLYFANQVKNLNEYQKEKLPEKTFIKLWKKGGVYNTRSTSKLSFLEKLYVLWKALNKKIYIFIEDEEKGATIEQFLKLKSDEKSKTKTEFKTEGLILSSSFVLASKELCDAFSYLNESSVSPAYHYLTKLKNTPRSKIAEYKKQVNYVWNFLANYESKKKIMNAVMQINMPEFLVLLYLYDGKYIKSSFLHNEQFRYSYQSSRTRLKLAFRTLQIKGFIIKTGTTNNAKIKISQLGIDKMNDIADRYFINW